MMRFVNNKKCVIATFLISTTLLGSQALAHKLSVFAFAEGNEVYLEGYFADGKRAQNSKVEVFNETGELLVEGVTGNEGEYRFTSPQAENLKIVVNAGMGHRSEYLLHADEIGDGATESQTSTVIDSVSDDEVEMSYQAQVSGLNSPQQLEKLVHRAVNEAIKPLVRELDEAQKKTSLTGIVGAIGFIFGFMGLFAYFKSRQMLQDKAK